MDHKKDFRNRRRFDYSLSDRGELKGKVMRGSYAEKPIHTSAAAETETDCSLTGREKKVLLLVAKAQSNKEIAVGLKISPSTVKRHLENILRKLGLKNRVEAAIYALRMNACPVTVDERPGNCPMRLQQTVNGQREFHWAIWPIDREPENVLRSRQ